MIPEILAIAVPENTISKFPRQKILLALALCLLNIQPSSRVIVKGKAGIPRDMLLELKNLELITVDPVSYKSYNNIRFPRGKGEVPKAELQTFVDRSEFLKTRVEWSERYQREVDRQRWRHLTLNHGGPSAGSMAGAGANRSWYST